MCYVFKQADALISVEFKMNKIKLIAIAPLGAILFSMHGDSAPVDTMVIEEAASSGKLDKFTEFKV